MSLSQQQPKKRKPANQCGSSETTKRQRTPKHASMTRRVNHVYIGPYKVDQRVSDKFFNLTKLAKVTKRSVKDFRDRTGTKRFVAILEVKIGKPVSTFALYIDLSLHL
jgi:hypothetical protein